MSTGEVWEKIAMEIDLKDVTVELILTHSDGRHCLEQSLAKLDFNHSTYKYKSFSDQKKTTMLVSKEIVMSDTRIGGICMKQLIYFVEKHTAYPIPSNKNNKYATLSSPELKARNSVVAVVVVVSFSHLRLLLQSHESMFNQILQKASMGEGNSRLLK